MRIAVFDHNVSLSSPIGGCHQRMISALCEEHEFVVVAARFDNPRPDRIRHVLVKVPMRPIALLFVAFHLMSGVAWRRYRRGGGAPPNLVQGVESNHLGCDVLYSQFCHRGYLKGSGGFSAGLLLAFRPFLRWVDHRLHAWLEPVVYRTAPHVVAPSVGLARELIDEYPRLADKITVIANPIDVEALRMPADFQRGSLRGELGFSETDFVLVFTALGHFERKGLPIVMEAMAAIGRRDLKLLVVGGEESLVRAYTRQAAVQGIGDQIAFVGHQTQVRRFLWAADAFVFPSAYETFSLSTYEAAGAGLPIIVTRLHGVEDFVRDRDNAFLVDRSAGAVRSALEELLTMSGDERRKMGQRAQDAVSGFTIDRFAAGWRNFYEHLMLAHTANPRFSPAGVATQP